MPTDAPKGFVGTWRLVHTVEFMADGRTHYPFGLDAVGYIVYSESGVMAVQISRKTRSRDQSENLVGPADYLAYVGRDEIDTENELVRHILEGQLFPGGHPDTLERKYRFFDDKLSLKPWDGTNREILWQRAANK
jgi:Lipocalin-like domain